MSLRKNIQLIAMMIVGVLIGFELGLALVLIQQIF